MSATIGWRHPVAVRQVSLKNTETGLDQPHQACWPHSSYADKRSSTLNASAAAVITRTNALVQSSSYSRAVPFCCCERLVLSRWNHHHAFWWMCGIYQVIFSWLCKFSACVQQILFSIGRREGLKSTHCQQFVFAIFLVHNSFCKRLLINSSGRKCFGYGATAETAKVNCMRSTNEQLAHRNMVFMPQDQTSNTLRELGHCAAVSAHGRLTERPGTAARSLVSRSALVTSGADLLLG